MESDMSTTESDSLSLRAPSNDSINSFLLHLTAHPENQELMDMQVTEMLRKSQKDTECLHLNRGRSMTEKLISLIFLMCNKFRMTDLVKYRAIELFDRLMMAVNSDFFVITKSCSSEIKKKCESNLKEKYLLDIATCIQLASKMVGITGVVSIKDVKSVLFPMGLRVDDAQVLQSELMAMKMMNFDLNTITPLELVEGLLILLGLEKVEYRRLYCVCISIIDAVYLGKDDIYRTFSSRKSKEKQLSINEKEYLRLENDYILRASAVIHCGVVMTYPVHHPYFQSKLVALEGLTGIDKTEILNLSSCITYFILTRPS